MHGGRGSGTLPGADETRLACHSSLPTVPKASNSPPHTTTFFISCSSHRSRCFPRSPPVTPAETAHLADGPAHQLSQHAHCETAAQPWKTGRPRTTADRGCHLCQSIGANIRTHRS